MRLAHLALVALAPVGFATAQPAPPLRDFDAYVQKAVADWSVPGLAVSVVKDGQVVFQKGYGVCEIAKPAPVDAKTLFAIGSTTKAMTAAAIGMLVDEKKLGWDHPVVQYLPDFQLYDPYVTREITVRDLLTHRAGLPGADFLWYRVETAPLEILKRMRFLKPETSLRSHFAYQNIMYHAAGELVGAVSGSSWSVFLKQRIFEPLGMTSTVTSLDALAGQKNVASPHDRVEGKVKAISNASVDSVAAAGAVWSSVEDMAKWMRFLLNGGKVGDKALLTDSTHRELFTPQTMVGPDTFYPTAKLTKPHWTTYGLGWFQQDYQGRAVDFHTGSIDGMVAIHGLIRDEKLGVYVLANLDHAEVRHALMLRVFDLYRGSKPREEPSAQRVGGGAPTLRDWSSELFALYDGLRREGEEREQKAEQERVSGTSPSLALEKYAGTYSDPLYGTVVVALDGNLRITRGPTFSATLEHWNYDTFRARWDLDWLGKSLVSFALDAKGNVTAVELNGMRLARQP